MSIPARNSFAKIIFYSLAALSALFLGAMFPGCLFATKSVVAVYAPQSDEFRFLTVFQRIGSDKPENEPADQQWLKALYENRRDLVIAPDPMFAGWGEWAALRLPGNRWTNVPLTQTPQGGLVSHPAGIPLEQLQVLPGRFFLRGPDDLCYYQQLIVPGKMADAILAYYNQEFATPGKNMPLDWLGQLIDRRAKQQATLSWDDFTHNCILQAIASLNGTPAATQPTTAPTPTIPFESASLRMLHDDLLAGKLPLVRHGDQVTFTLEMTESDVAGAVTFCDQFRAALEDQLAQDVPDIKPEDANTRAQLARLLECASVTASDQTHVQVTIDLVSLFNSFDDPIETNPDVDQSGHDAGRRMAQYAAANLDLDSDLTVESIEQDFKSGTLKGYPLAQPVAAGTDLGGIHPATQPTN